MAVNSTSFKPGQSGNPRGRPLRTEEEIEFDAACKERTLGALETILAIMQNGDNERNRLSAAQFIIERGWGKAKQAMQLPGTDEEN